MQQKVFSIQRYFGKGKRPITIDVLKRERLQSVACFLSKENEYFEMAKRKGTPHSAAQVTQLHWLEKRRHYNDIGHVTQTPNTRWQPGQQPRSTSLT
jgi:hypothetical protein